MASQKGVSAWDIGALLVLLGAVFLAYNQVVEFQAFRELGSGVFQGSAPQPQAITTPLTLLTPGIRWSHMPLTVYIDSQNRPPGWAPEFTLRVASAAEEITEKTGGLVSFANAESAEKADIAVRWVPRFSFAKTLDAVGHAELTFIPFDGRALITSAQIEMLVRVDGRALTQDEMQNTALHELGHALGLNHTDDLTSMMYPVANEAVLSPNPNDAETLRRVYSQEARADLSIASAHAMKKAQKGILFSRYYVDGDVTVKNIGYLDTSSVLLRIKADGDTVYEETLSDVRAGQSVSFTFENIDAGKDFETVQFELGPQDDFREYDEGNNVAAVNV